MEIRSATQGRVTAFDPAFLLNAGNPSPPSSAENTNKAAMARTLKIELKQLLRKREEFNRKTSALKQKQKGLLEKESSVLKSIHGNAKGLHSTLINLDEYQKSTSLDQTLGYFSKLQLRSGDNSDTLLASFEKSMESKVGEKIKLDKILDKNADLNLKINSLIDAIDPITRSLENYIQAAIARYLELLEVQKEPSANALESVEVRAKYRKIIREDIESRFTDSGVANLDRLDADRLEKLRADLSSFYDKQQKIRNYLDTKFTAEEIGKHFPVLASRKYSTEAAKQLGGIEANKENIETIVRKRRTLENIGIGFEQILSIPLNEDTLKNLRQLEASYQVRSELNQKARSDAGLREALSGVDYNSPEIQGKLNLFASVRRFKEQIIDKAGRQYAALIHSIPYTKDGSDFISALSGQGAEETREILEKLEEASRIFKDLPQPKTHMHKALKILQEGDTKEKMDDVSVFARNLKSNWRKLEKLMQHLEAQGLDISRVTEYLDDKNKHQDYKFAFTIGVNALSKLARRGRGEAQKILDAMPIEIAKSGRSEMIIDRILNKYSDLKPPPRGDKSNRDYASTLRDWGKKIQAFEAIKKEVAETKQLGKSIRNEYAKVNELFEDVARLKRWIKDQLYDSSGAHKSRIIVNPNKKAGALVKAALDDAGITHYTTNPRGYHIYTTRDGDVPKMEAGVNKKIKSIEAEIQTKAAKLEEDEQTAEDIHNIPQKEIKDITQFSEENLAKITNQRDNLRQRARLAQFLQSKNIDTSSQCTLEEQITLLRQVKSVYMENSKEIDRVTQKLGEMTLEQVKNFPRKSKKYQQVASLREDIGLRPVSKSKFMEKSMGAIRKDISTLNQKLEEVKEIKKVIQSLKSSGIAVHNVEFSKEGLKQLKNIQLWKENTDNALEQQVDVFALSRELLLKQMSTLKSLVEIQKEAIKRERDELNEAREHIASLNSLMPADKDGKHWIRQTTLDFMNARGLAIANPSGLGLTQTQFRSNIETIRGYVEKKNNEVQMLMQEFEYINKVRLESPEFLASIVTLFYQSATFSVQNF